MTTTWYDIKLASLQKMFSAEGTTIPTDESTVDYLASMPYACNEALQLISTAGKFIIKSISIAHFPVQNLISDGVAKTIHTIYNDETFEIEADNVHSYSVEYLGTGTLQIYVGETELEPIEIDTPFSFVELKGNVENALNQKVRYVFTAKNQVSVKSIGLYNCAFPDERDIPSYKKYIKYPIKEYAPDFYQLDSNQIYYEGNGIEEYIQPSDFFQEGNRVLVLPREKAGNYTIYYKAYPEQITSETPDEYEFPIDEEVAPLIPLYIASQLYKDDDNGIATTYRNEFEVAFERLSQKANVPSIEGFVSKSGWI